MAKKQTSSVRSRTPLQEKVDEAEAAGQFMVAVWHLKDGQLHLYRQTHDFPVADIEAAVFLLKSDLGKEKAASTPT